MLPLALKYLVSLGLEVASPVISVTDYIDLIRVIMLGLGVVFETPVLLVVLALLNVVAAESLAAHRRVTFVVILVIAVIIIPPDPISMLGMAIPSYFMHELSIFIIRFLKPPNELSAGLPVTLTQKDPQSDAANPLKRYTFRGAVKGYTINIQANVWLGI